MNRHGNEEFDDGRYSTPASFRRTKESEELDQRFQEEQQERGRRESVNEPPNHHTTDNQPEQDDMSNPYLDRGYSMPYQISQNKYREQVFGSHPVYNYPSDKPEPLDGRTLPPRSIRPTSDTPQDRYYQDRGPMYEQQNRKQVPHETPRQQVPHESPRQQLDYGQQSYRSGRPDLGFQSDQPFYVPYPQEPVRRRREYEQPPDIGYDPYSQQDAPKPHPGWLLLLRFHKDGEAEVRRALTMCAKHIDSDGGRILGIAPTRSVHIREGGDAWVTFGKMRYFGGGKWGVQESPEEERTNYCVLAIYYPSLSRAIQWFDRDSCFKHKDFPARYTTDCIALPLNSSVDTKHCRTLVMTEYPKISHPEYFRDKFSIPTEDMMRRRFGATPYVVKTTSIPTDDPRQRVARHLRGCWIKRNSIITVSMFDSKQETNRYFTDPEYFKCKEAQDRVSAPTSVIIGLEDWRL